MMLALKNKPSSDDDYGTRTVTPPFYNLICVTWFIFKKIYPIHNFKTIEDIFMKRVANTKYHLTMCRE